MPAQCDIERTADADDTAVLRLSGSWRTADGVPQTDDVVSRLQSEPPARRVAFDTAGLAEWDSGLLTFLRKLAARCADSDIAVDQGGLPEGVRRLLALASAVPPPQDLRPRSRPSWLGRLGAGTLDLVHSSRQAVRFVGECLIAFARMLVGRAQFRGADLLRVIQQSGADAFWIVSLISFLVGLILAYIGSVQLRTFGAQIYVADLVAVAMTREMAAIMTAIVMAGRTGAAFAARLGTMQVNEEIDAFRTMGISPVEFLVLPRVLALVLMMPLLVLYADVMGVLGGALIGVGALDLTPMEYYHQTVGAVNLYDFGIGLFKGAVFGVLVAVAGCLRGMQCGRSAEAVGRATTSAVVTGIVLIISSDAVITILCDVLGI